MLASFAKALRFIFAVATVNLSFRWQLVSFSAYLRTEWMVLQVKIEFYTSFMLDYSALIYLKINGIY